MKKQSKRTTHVTRAGDRDADLSQVEQSAEVVPDKAPPALIVPEDAPGWIREYIAKRGWIPAPPAPPTPEEATVLSDASALAKTDPVGALSAFGTKPPLEAVDPPTEHGVPASFAGVFVGSPELAGRTSELKMTLGVVCSLLSVYFEPLHPKGLPESVIAGGIFGEDEVGFSYFDSPEPGGQVKTLLLAAAWVARERGGSLLFLRAAKEARTRFLTKGRAEKRRRPA